MAPHSSTLALKIPWMEEPGGLQSMGSLRVGHDWATSLWFFTFMRWRRKWQPTPVFLPGESQGRGGGGGRGVPGRLPSMGLHRVRHDWSDLAAAAAERYLVAHTMKNPPANAGDVSSVPGLRRSPMEGNDCPLQYSYLENSMDRGARWIAVHVVANCLTQLSN